MSLWERRHKGIGVGEEDGEGSAAGRGGGEYANLFPVYYKGGSVARITIHITYTSLSSMLICPTFQISSGVNIFRKKCSTHRRWLDLSALL